MIDASENDPPLSLAARKAARTPRSSDGRSSSITTCAFVTSCWSEAMPSGRERSRSTLSEPRPKCLKRSPAASQPRGTLREGDPAPSADGGCSTRMTRAPRPESSCDATAPASRRLALTTVMPLRGDRDADKVGTPLLVASHTGCRATICGWAPDALRRPHPSANPCACASATGDDAANGRQHSKLAAEEAR